MDSTKKEKRYLQKHIYKIVNLPIETKAHVHHKLVELNTHTHVLLPQISFLRPLSLTTSSQC